MKKIKLSLLAFLVVAGFAVSGKKVVAENQDTPKGFSMSPFFQEINLEEGQDRGDFVLDITNNTPTAAALKLSVVDFGALDESGGVAFLGSAEDLKNKYALASWVSLEKDALVINAGEKQSVKVTIQNKDSLSPGGHYAAVMAKMENEDNGTGSESSIIAVDPSFASLIFVRKIGGEVYGLTLKENEIGRNFLSLPSTVRLRFQNPGNVHVTPRGIIKLSDPLGREIVRGIINSESAIILPETFRKFPVELKRMALAYLPGRYKLSVEYRFDGEDDFIIKDENIDFVPVPAILTGLVIIGLFGVYGWYKFGANKRNRGEKKEKSFK